MEQKELKNLTNNKHVLQFMPERTGRFVLFIFLCFVLVLFLYISKHFILFLLAEIQNKEKSITSRNMVIVSTMENFIFFFVCYNISQRVSCTNAFGHFWCVCCWHHLSSRFVLSLSIACIALSSIFSYYFNFVALA